MFAFLSGHKDHILGIARILIGINFAVHGAQKLFGFPVEFPVEAAEQMGAIATVAGVIELVGGLMIALGVMTTLAAFVSSGLMAAAYFIAHGFTAFWPIVNQGELALTYCWFFLFVAAYGPGAFSLDAMRASGGGGGPAVTSEP